MRGRNFIKGQWAAGNGPAFSSASPADGKEIWRGNEAAKADVDRAFAAAKRAFLDWRNRPHGEREALVRAYARACEKRKDALAETISRETGKVRWDADGEVSSVINKAEIAIRAYHERTPTRVEDKGKARARLTHRPHGVMGVIGPYNFPCHLANGHIVPAILAGNAVVFKPSSFTPASAEVMVECWEEAGAPEGLVNLVQGTSAVGKAMVAHPDLRGLLFTGGVGTGKILARSLAERLEVVLALELGGNNPLVVWRAEDLEAAAIVSLQSAFISSGQRCTCARRLIVQDGKAGEKFLGQLVDMAQGIAVGRPDADPAPFMGPVINGEAADSVLARQALLEEKGAKPLLKARRLNLGPAYISPGIIDVTGAKGVPDEEIFGPLLQVIRANDFDHAIRIANDTRYGLAAGILTDDEKLRDRFFAEIEAGVVNWNQVLPGASSEAPFGGVKLSGNHRPSAYYAADYAAWPMASLENPSDKLTRPPLPKGFKG